MRYYIGNLFFGDDLRHYRTAGSKNGVRRYQYPDGSLTPEGRIHYDRPLPSKKKNLGGKKPVKKAEKKKTYSFADSEYNISNRKVSRVSADELKEKTDRIKLENEYITQRNKRKDFEKKTWFGSKLKDALGDAAIDVAKSVVKDYLKSKATGK